jgi:hypothetical protein
MVGVAHDILEYYLIFPGVFSDFEDAIELLFPEHRNLCDDGYTS